jgi:hypothetical protein
MEEAEPYRLGLQHNPSSLLLLAAAAAAAAADQC